MRTQLDYAKAGIVTEEMRQAAAVESVSPEELRDLIGQGLAVLPKNVGHSFPILRAIGKNLKTKVNANLGTSGECASREMESAKLKAALDAQTDSIMDLSTGGDLAGFRHFFLENSPVMVGPCPSIPSPRRWWPSMSPWTPWTPTAFFEASKNNVPRDWTTSPSIAESPWPR